METQKNKQKAQTQQVQKKTHLSQQHKDLFYQGQDSYSVSDDRVVNQGRATFKVQMDPIAEKPSQTGYKKSTAQEDDSDPNKAGRMLKTEEIRMICDKHKLSRMEVYNIRSQFSAMAHMSKIAEEEELAAQGEDAKKNGKKMFGAQTEGISLPYFKKNCSFLAGCLP